MDDPYVIRLDSHLEIRDIDTFYQAFLGAFECHRPLAIDVSRLDVVDTAGMQLLLAVRQEAAVRGVAMTFVGHSTALCDSLTRVGLSRQVFGAVA